MDDQNNTTVTEGGSVIEVPVVPSPTQEDLLAAILQAIPSLRGVSDSLDMVISMNMLYVGRMSRDLALADLDLSFDTDKNGVARACEAIKAALDEEWAKARADYDSRIEEGDQPLEGLDFDAFEALYQREKNEQDLLMALARNLMAAIQRVSLKLGIPVPVAEKLEEPVEPKSVFLRVLDRMGRHSGGRVNTPFFSYQVTQPISKTPTTATWTTPPVINTNDKGYRLFMEVIVTNADQYDDVDALWREQFNPRKTISPARLLSLMTNLAQLARDQMKQSIEVLKTVNADHESDTTRIAEIREVQALIVALVDYFQIEIQ